MSTQDTNGWPTRGRFRKRFQPYGVRLTPETAEEIENYDDCRIMRDEDGDPIGAEVQTREGTLDDVGMGAWIMEDSDGCHYPIADEEIRQTYEPAQRNPQSARTQNETDFVPLEIRDGDYICPRIGPIGKNWDIAEVRLPDGHMSTEITDVPLKAYEDQKRWAQLFAAAGTAAHEAAEMGYDNPQAVVEALPELLAACKDVLDSMKAPDMRRGTLTSAGMRDRLRDALASAEGDG